MTFFPFVYSFATLQYVQLIHKKHIKSKTDSDACNHRLCQSVSSKDTSRFTDYVSCEMLTFANMTTVVRGFAATAINS